MRALYVLLPLAACLGGHAYAADAPYYGPMKAWRGIGYKYGVKDAVQPDGSVRIDTATRGREATELALYRAAEIARDQGYAFVEMLGGSASQGPGRSTATLYARPSRTAARPATCWKDKPKGCYTADVAEVLRRLGGPDGSQPGVALSSATDEYGRSVSYGGVDFGFGVGAVSATPPRPAASPVAAGPTSVAHALAASPRGVVGRSSVRPAPTAADRFAQALREVQPVNGREASGRWTIGD